MLRLNHIALTFYKNYQHANFHFPENVVGICGLNGVGKTNLLDAIYYCCFTKSYFSTTDYQNIGHGQEGFRLQAEFSRNGENNVVTCINRGLNKKEFRLNDVPYTKYSKHIGWLPVVMIAPDDIELITGSGETRRRFIDTVLSQVDPGYLQHLINYNKVLAQRNSLLKNFQQQGADAGLLLKVLDQQLLEPASKIYEKRKEFLEKLIPAVNGFYDLICSQSETITLEYLSQLHENDMQGLLNASLQNDLLLQRTGCGVHKDDIALRLNGNLFKQVASQGQRKSLLFALKLAEFEMIRLQKNFAPILLLDDVFEKLDDNRMKNLLNWVCSHANCQVFITDTHRERLEETFTHLGVGFSVISL